MVSRRKRPCRSCKVCRARPSNPLLGNVPCALPFFVGCRVTIWSPLFVCQCAIYKRSNATRWWAYADIYKRSNARRTKCDSRCKDRATGPAQQKSCHPPPRAAPGGTRVRAGKYPHQHHLPVLNKSTLVVRSTTVAQCATFHLATAFLYSQLPATRINRQRS